MKERRRCKRLPIDLKLNIKDLFKQGYEHIDGVNGDIEVINVSKTGIGFLTEDKLPLNYYFDAKIRFDSENYFGCVIKLVRQSREGEYFEYGGEFVGLAPFLADMVDEYEKSLNI